MDPLLIAILLLVVGIVLLVGELFLPTHGAVGVLGAGAILAAIVFAFIYNAWVGVGLLVACMIATPFAWTAAMHIWPRTPIGRRLVLQNKPVERPTNSLFIGQEGQAISHLRPMGTCEFDGQRVEAISARGIIPAGNKVRIIIIDNNRPTVESA